MNNGFDLPLDATLGGLKVYGEANCNLNKYINTLDTIKIPSRVDSNTFYYKVCRVSLLKKDTYLNSKFFIYRYDNNASRVNEFMEVVIKAGFSDLSAGGTQQISLLVKNSKVLSRNNLKYIVVQNDANGYIVDVYFLHYESSASYQLQKHIEKSNNSKATITFYDNGVCETLPTGTLITSLIQNTTHILQIWYDGSSWNITGLDEAGSKSAIYGLPVWNINGVEFEYGKPLLDVDTKFLSVTPRYISSSSLAYTPVINYNNYLNDSNSYYYNVAWASTTAYLVDNYIYANGKVYKCTVAGTSGNTAPSHTTGTATDGTVTWQYITDLPKRRIAFFDTSTGLRVNTPDTRMSFYLTIQTSQ